MTAHETKPLPVFTPEDRRRIREIALVDDRTITSFFEGKARPASVTRIERALCELERERERQDENTHA